MTRRVIASFRGASTPVETVFKVLAPTGIDHTTVSPTGLSYSKGDAGAGMHLKPYLAPTTVCFSRVECKEVGEAATDVTGYFTNVAADLISHKGHGAGEWIPIGEDNSWQEPWDNAASGPWPSPFQGGYKWEIPGRWHVVGTTNEYPITLSPQEFSMDASGTMTVRKFGHTVTRGTNQLTGTVQ